MEPGKDLATQVLSGLGFEVSEIDVGKNKRADLLVTDNTSVYLVEVKDKWEGESLAAQRRDALERGEIHEQVDPLFYQNCISRVFRRARTQLSETANLYPGSFRLIWLHADGIDADTKYRQAFATLYGLVHLTPLYPNGNLPERECFYFDHNSAYQMPDVEAVIISDRTQLQFCLNEFASRASEFRATALFQRLKSEDAIIDPVAMEAAGRIITCRIDMPRNDENATARALREQTGVLYKPIRLNRFSASAPAVLPPQPTGEKCE